MTETNKDFTKNPVVLSVEHVSKSFKLPTEQATGLKQACINWFKGIKGYKEQRVLKDISFEVHQASSSASSDATAVANPHC